MYCNIASSHGILGERPEGVSTVHRFAPYVRRFAPDVHRFAPDVHRFTPDVHRFSVRSLWKLLPCSLVFIIFYIYFFKFARNSLTVLLKTF